jgi:type I restriction enzyme, S subunit
VNAHDLKNSVLQLAIQGKLVKQRKEEGTAEEQYQLIQAEKKNLIKEGKIKKTKALSEIAEGEVPFDIPENWKWVRLGELIHLTSGQDMTSNKYNDTLRGIPYLTGASNIQDGKIIINRWTPEPKAIALRGDILLTCKGTVGKTVILNEEEVHIARQIMSIRTIHTDAKFIQYFLKSYVSILKSKAKSMIPGIERKDVLEALFPLPPLEEQKRIVAKIEELKPYVEKYDKAYTEVEELNKKFPDDMQKSILQYAIHGKLVEQREEERTADEIYLQIQEEKAKLVAERKIKKPKKLAEVTDAEIPFDIPKSWKWVRLGDVLTKITDGTHHSPANFDSGEFMYVTAKNIKESGVDLSNITYVPAEVHQQIFDRCNPEYGDILLIKDGATTGIVTINNIREQFSLLSSVAVLKVPALIFASYIVYVLRSDLFYRNIRKQMKGTGITRITLKQIEPLLIPLPPLEEQKRIVEKIEQVLPYTKQLIK